MSRVGTLVDSGDSSAHRSLCSCYIRWTVDHTVWFCLRARLWSHILFDKYSKAFKYLICCFWQYCHWWHL